MRIAIVLSIVLVASTARAETYLSADVGGQYVTGKYTWSSPPLIRTTKPTTVNLDATVSGWGVGGEVSGGLSHRWLSVGPEIGGAFASTSTEGLAGYSKIDDLFLVRVGGRIEARCKYPLFARASFGGEWMNTVGESSDLPALENAWDPESLRGIYGSLGLGVRMVHLGILGKLEYARLTSTHATFRPLTMFLGADLRW